ncbi:CDP-glycerol glycerophosphotransferase family protein [Butyrivibrio sp. FC2001]|uniref:CDP-glycerol glycerophosphotransferase family protein n=1 Tax=Butyrivibrio sp. FC2001 TaxID=1280671 RepID=UPI0004794A81|nr:CDP-glycerol glycerophosphotransferase family protein [Butyrivibrio sp. FC2001]
MDTSDIKYIEMRKRKARRLSLLFRLFWVLPINKKKVTFSAFEGDGGFGCNPRYIAEELHRRRPDLKLVWLLHDPTKDFPDFIKPIKDTTFNTVFHLATSKVWIDNYRKPFGTLKRKKQLYIQTWHATIGFKAVGLYRGDAFPEIARLVSEWDSNLADFFLSNSEYCDRVYPKKLLYKGPTLRVGSPRVDPLINNKEKLHAQIREELSLDKDMKLVLFAPTFRGGNQQGQKQVIAETPQIDFDRLIKVLGEKFGGEWRILLRLHPQLSAKLDEMPLLSKDSRLIDVSQMPDISEIMGGCDLVITDYSSCAFDAAFAMIPVLLYADDVEEYVKNRGQFMWKREELPFAIADNNEELEDNVKNFDLDKYLSAVHEFINRNEVIEDGHASERVTEVVERII